MTQGDKAAARTFVALVFITACAAATIIYGGVQIGKDKAAAQKEVANATGCMAIGARIHQIAEWDNGDCWIIFDNGTTLPWVDARELIKFNYKRGQGNGTTKKN